MAPPVVRRPEINARNAQALNELNTNQAVLDAESPWYQRFWRGFDSDFSAGGEDMRKVGHKIRELEGKQAEAPKAENMVLSWLTGQRLKELAGKSSNAGLVARDDLDLGLSKDPWTKAGQVVGTAAGDITQDATRRFYWLLNALQATGEVLNEGIQATANPALYGRTPVRLGASDLTVKDVKEAVKMGAAKLDPNDPDGKRLIPRRGYSIKDGKFEKRNYEPGWVQSLSWPSGIAINAGLGLMTPFGGAEGYKAAIPSEEDPTKTANMIGEIGLKYIMGRTGNLLPYDEFKQVRPDVSKGEYNAYKAFKYDKEEDWNPLDGDMTMFAGGLKATDEGIHGPEIQFLGRSLPVTTGVVPYLTAVAGGAAGVRRPRAIRGGLIGGTTGLVAGQIAGNLLEQERRRRNAAENELYAPPTLVG